MENLTHKTRKNNKNCITLARRQLVLFAIPILCIMEQVIDIHNGIRKMLSSIIRQRHQKVIIIITAIASVMIYSMFDVAPAFADDTTPPPPQTESVELPPADESVDPVSAEITPIEEPAVDSSSAKDAVDPAPAEIASQEPATDSSLADESVDSASTEIAPIEEPAVDLSPADEPVDPAPINDISLNPDDLSSSDDLFQPQPIDTSSPTTLSQVPENITIAVMVDGEVASLASQDAADAILLNDPMWCPTGKLPGDLECTGKFASVTILINSLGTESGPGTIYFTPVYSYNDVSFIHTDPKLKNLGALTLQGGWNGLSGIDYVLSGVTTFSESVTIDWNNTTVTINDITISGASGNGLTVTNSGNIVLDNVRANDNNGYGAFLDNTAGNGNVTLTGTNTFNGNGSDGLHILTKGDINIAGSDTGNENGGNGASLDNSAGSGNVNLKGAGIFDGNSKSGLKTFSNGSITLVNITASNNVDGYGAFLNNSAGSGDVTLTGTNVFNNNRLDGLYINANGNIEISDVTANSNGGSGLFLQSTADITIDFCTNAANNGGAGTYANLLGAFKLMVGNFSRNGLGEYAIAGGGARNIKDCAPEREAKLTSEQTALLDCAETTLILPNGDYVLLPCPIGEASLTPLTEDDLKDTLPEGTTFASGFNLQIATKVGSIAVGGESPISANETMTVSFTIPEVQLNADLALLFWNGSKWVEVEGVIIENGRINAQVDLNIRANFDGLFILVSK